MEKKGDQAVDGVVAWGLAASRDDLSTKPGLLNGHYIIIRDRKCEGVKYAFCYLSGRSSTDGQRSGTRTVGIGTHAESLKSTRVTPPPHVHILSRISLPHPLGCGWERAEEPASSSISWVFE